MCNSLFAHGRRLDHEIPDRNRDFGIDHLKIPLRHDVKSDVGREELHTIVVAVVGELYITHGDGNETGAREHALRRASG